MGFQRWEQLTRDELASLIPRAVTVLPVAAIEQHGPHLATATDALLVTEVARRACAQAGRLVDVVLAPTQCFGASDHHLPFGATLSLTTQTLHTVLMDLARSVQRAGGRRLLLLNGHGGNAPTCAAVAALAAREHDMLVASCAYWDLARAPADMPFPGHAGVAETSLVLAVRPRLVHLDLARPSPAPAPMPTVPGLHVEDPAFWQRIDGFTDDPRAASAAVGEKVLDDCCTTIGRLISSLANDELMPGSAAARSL